MTPKTDERIINMAADRIDARAGLKQLGLMVGIRSTKQATDWEAKAVADESADIRKEVFDVCPNEGKPDESEGGDMRDVMAAGPVNVYHGVTAEQQKQTATATKSTNTASKILAGGLSALALGAAITAPIVAWRLTTPKQTTDSTQRDLGARFVPVPQPKQ